VCIVSRLVFECIRNVLVSNPNPNLNLDPNPNPNDQNVPQGFTYDVISVCKKDRFPSIFLSCLALPCLALPCLALPCLALPCLAWHCLALYKTSTVSL
jgi:hypothetical protein